MLFLPSFEKEVQLFMVYAFNIQGNSEMFLVWESLALFISNKNDRMKLICLIYNDI